MRNGLDNALARSELFCTCALFVSECSEEPRRAEQPA